MIAGASGCGKTTLVRSINGLVPRSYKGELSGKILMQGKETTSLTLARISQMVGTVNARSWARACCARWLSGWKTWG